MIRGRKTKTVFAVCTLLGVLLLGGCRPDQMDYESGSAGFEGEEPYVIAIENLTLGEDYVDTEMVESAINDILLPAINCKVDIVNYHIADHATKVSLAIAGGEKLDLINTGLTTTLSEYVADATVIPLDDLLDAYGSKLKEKEGELLKATTINGSIYAISGNLYPNKANGLGYNEDILEQYGLTMPDTVNLDTLTELGDKLYHFDGDAYLANNADGSLSVFDVYYFCETFGVDFTYGVIFNPLENTEIVNVYKSEEYEKYCKTLKSWVDAGYMPSDSIFAGLNGQEAFNSGNVLIQQMNISPHGEQMVIKKGLDFGEGLMAATPNVISTSSVQEYAWGITASCEHPEKVMMFLEMLYTDSELANLMNYGIEGLHYEKVSDSIIRYPKDIDGESVGYGRVFSMFGDTMQTYQFEPATENFYAELLDYNRQATPLLTLGYTFNTAPVKSEIAAVTDVVTEFRPILELGVSDNVDETIDEFNTELEKAGIDRIIDENQRQLNAWLGSM